MRVVMQRLPRAFAGGLPALCLGAALFAAPAHAGLFDDDEARKAILDLRQRIEQGNELQRTRSTEQAAKLSEQIDTLRRSLLELNNQIEQLRGDNARLRGQNEQLARDLSEVQRLQKDMQAGLDDRMRKMEPQKVSFEGREFVVEPEEKRQYDEAMDALRKSDFERTSTLLTTFRRRYPTSGYGESALFWLGNAQYGSRQYKDAIGSFRALVSASPESPKSPEALLAIANCYAELKDGKTARRTIEELVKSYPKSEAAQAGKERLVSLK